MDSYFFLTQNCLISTRSFHLLFKDHFLVLFGPPVGLSTLLDQKLGVHQYQAKDGYINHIGVHTCFFFFPHQGTKCIQEVEMLHLQRKYSDPATPRQTIATIATTRPIWDRHPTPDGLSNRTFYRLKTTQPNLCR